jgi:hypothetical protein
MDMILLFALVYLLPAMIATLRAHPQVVPIWVVTVFLGWTLLGWVGALAWAVSGHASAPTEPSGG